MEELLNFPHWWIFFIFVTSLNAAIFRLRAKRHMQQHPELAAGYATLTRGFLAWGNLPWIVMAVGSTIGGVPRIWHYFRPQNGNPYVLAFFASTIVIWILGFYWVFLRGGAEMLVKHPGMFERDFSKPSQVKLLYALAVAGGVFGTVLMFLLDFPLPPR
jgi:hypothetical protein